LNLPQLIRTQLAVDPSSIYDASFTGLFRDYYPPGSVGRERVSAMAAVVFEFVLRWTGHVNECVHDLSRNLILTS
jgi:hypothetical protein